MDFYLLTSIIAEEDSLDALRNLRRSLSFYCESPPSVGRLVCNIEVGVLFTVVKITQHTHTVNDGTSPFEVG